MHQFRRSSVRGSSSNRSKLPLALDPLVSHLMPGPDLTYGGNSLQRTHAATSAYVSMASMPFLFFSAMGMTSLLAAIKSWTL